MSAESNIGDAGPLWHAQVLKVEDDRPRLRLPKQLAIAVSWLASSNEDLSCLATVGVRGGIQVYPRTALSDRSNLLTRLSLKQLRRTAAGSDLLDYARYSSTSWHLTIAVESSRYALYLPEEARKLRLVPTNGERAVVFAAGEILEVWTTADWIGHLRRVGAKIDYLEQTVLRELQSGGSDD